MGTWFSSLPIYRKEFFLPGGFHRMPGLRFIGADPFINLEKEFPTGQANQ
jgi:hypothetical protein